MNEAVWVVIGAALGGVITLVATFVNFFFGNRTLKKEFNRTNFEEIYTVALSIFDILENGIETTRPSFPPVYSASTRSEDAVISNQYRKQYEDYKFRLEMLVNFYSDNLLTKTTAYLISCDEVFEKRKNISTSKELEEFEKLLDDLKGKKSYYLKAIYAEARKNY